MADPVNSSDEAVATAHARHDIFNPSAPECSYGEGFRLQPSDHESTVADGHTITNSLRYGCWLRSHDAEVAAAVRAEAVADERRRIADEIAQDIHGATLANPELTADFGYNRGLEKAADIARRSGSFDVRASDLLGAWSDDVAAGSVPVATPEPTGQSRRDLIVCSHCLLTPAEIDATDHHSGGWCPGRVATPPAEPAARVTRESIQRLADAILAEPFRPVQSQPWSDPDHDVMGDLRRMMAAPIDLLTSLQANLPPAPSQPVTCEHGKPRAHEVLEDGLLGWCPVPGPVSVPKESSE